MNIVPLIQEKWSLVGTRLKLSSDKLDDIWKEASEQQIPTESKNTFCCVKMLTSWYETSDNVSVDAILIAIDAPHVGLKTVVSSIKAALTSEYAPIDSNLEKSATNPPEKLELSYFNMITKFCIELRKSKLSISDILVYLEVCNINSEVLEKVYDFPKLIKSLEKHELVNKTDLSWLKIIANHARCTKATKVTEEYEKLLIADKIPWHRSHSEGTYIVGKTDKKPESVTIKDSRNAKSAVSKIVNIKESDSVLNFSEVGSVTFYWRIVNKSVKIEIPEVTLGSLIDRCRNVHLTHLGLMVDGNLNWVTIDQLGMYVH